MSSVAEAPLKNESHNEKIANGLSRVLADTYSIYLKTDSLLMNQPLTC